MRDVLAISVLVASPSLAFATAASVHHGALARTTSPQAAFLTAPAWSVESGQAGAHFGACVATAGDVNGDGLSDMIVGMPDYDGDDVDEGRALVYLGSPTGLALTPAWVAEGDQAGCRFGASVACAGDVNGDGYSDVIVGAPLFDGGESDEGRAFVYLGSPTGLAATPAWIVESDQAGAQFGFSVSCAGDVDADGFSDVVVGAPFHDGLHADAGRAFAFHGSASGLAASAAWTADGDHADARFAFSLSTAGDVDGDGHFDVIVGEPGFDAGGGSVGRARIFMGAASGLASTAAWTAVGAHHELGFGSAVATAGDVDADGFCDVLVGAPFDDGVIYMAGRAYLYVGSALGVRASVAWEGSDGQESFGASVATAGDVNGDGRSDLIVGDPLFDGTQFEEGQVFLYVSKSSGPDVPVALTAIDAVVDARLGGSLAMLGDVNGDGLGDFALGSPSFGDGELGEGRVSVHLGASRTLTTDAQWFAQGDQAQDRFGSALASTADVNGDGFSDLIVGAPRYVNSPTNSGRVYIYAGSPTGPATSATWTLASHVDGWDFGSRVANAGDVNGDGYDDILVASELPFTIARIGRVVLHLGSANGPSPSTAWSAVATAGFASVSFGASIACAGDVNGDGRADVLVGSPYVRRAYLYLGTGSGLSASPVSLGAELDQASFGAWVATAGDVDADGYSDVIIGAPDATNVEAQEGHAYLYRGSRGGLAAQPSWVIEGGASNVHLGGFVASAGDVDGDGYSDVVVSILSNRRVYRGSAVGLETTASWTSAGFVRSVSAGDVDGDGYSDLVVARQDDFALFRGSPAGLNTDPEWETKPPDDGLAIYTSSGGDVDGDGFSDVFLGMPTSGSPLAARVLLHLGNEALGSSTRAAAQRRVGGSTPIAVLGHAGFVTGGASHPAMHRAHDEFELGLTLEQGLAGFAWITPFAPIVALEWEIDELGGVFDGVGLKSGSSQALTSLPLSFRETREDLELDTAYRWRARIATNNPLAPVTRWVSAPGNARTEMKLRTLDRLSRR